MNLAIQLIMNTLQIGAVYVLFALGLTLIFGVMKVINFAHGEFFSITALIISSLVPEIMKDFGCRCGLPMSDRSWCRWSSPWRPRPCSTGAASRSSARPSRFLRPLGRPALPVRRVLLSIFGGVPRSCRRC